MKRKALWLRKAVAAITPRRRLRVVAGDSLPEKLPPLDLVVAREDDEDWCVGFRCPCGCGRKLELMLLENVRPRWKLTVDKRGRVSLHPSVWVKVGCRSHFWLKAGKVVWCD